MELLALGFLCAVFSAVIASSKGRSGFAWFLIRFFLGPFGPFGPFVAFLPSLKPEKPIPV